MTTRQTILHIMDDSRNEAELIARLADFVECERDRGFKTGEKSGRIGRKSDELLSRLART